MDVDSTTYHPALSSPLSSVSEMSSPSGLKTRHSSNHASNLQGRGSSAGGLTPSWSNFSLGRKNLAASPAPPPHLPSVSSSSSQHDMSGHELSWHCPEPLPSKQLSHLHLTPTYMGHSASTASFFALTHPISTAAGKPHPPPAPLLTVTLHLPSDFSSQDNASEEGGLAMMMRPVKIILRPKCISSIQSAFFSKPSQCPPSLKTLLTTSASNLPSELSRLIATYQLQHPCGAEEPLPFKLELSSLRFIIDGPPQSQPDAPLQPHSLPRPSSDENPFDWPQEQYRSSGSSYQLSLSTCDSISVTFKDLKISSQADSDGPEALAILKSLHSCKRAPSWSVATVDLATSLSALETDLSAVKQTISHSSMCNSMQSIEVHLLDSCAPSQQLLSLLAPSIAMSSIISLRTLPSTDSNQPLVSISVEATLFEKGDSDTHHRVPIKTSSLLRLTEILAHGLDLNSPKNDLSSPMNEAQTNPPSAAVTPSSPLLDLSMTLEAFTLHLVHDADVSVPPCSFSVSADGLSVDTIVSSPSSSTLGSNESFSLPFKAVGCVTGLHITNLTHLTSSSSDHHPLTSPWPFSTASATSLDFAYATRMISHSDGSKRQGWEVAGHVNDPELWGGLRGERGWEGFILPTTFCYRNEGHEGIADVEREPRRYVSFSFQSRVEGSMEHRESLVNLEGLTIGLGAIFPYLPHPNESSKDTDVVADVRLGLSIHIRDCLMVAVDSMASPSPSPSPSPLCSALLSIKDLNISLPSSSSFLSSKRDGLFFPISSPLHHLTENGLSSFITRPWPYQCAPKASHILLTDICLLVKDSKSCQLKRLIHIDNLSIHDEALLVASSITHASQLDLVLGHVSIDLSPGQLPILNQIQNSISPPSSEGNTASPGSVEKLHPKTDSVSLSSLLPSINAAINIKRFVARLFLTVDEAIEASIFNLVCSATKQASQEATVSLSSSKAAVTQCKLQASQDKHTASAPLLEFISARRLWISSLSPHETPRDIEHQLQPIGQVKGGGGVEAGSVPNHTTLTIGSAESYRSAYAWGGSPGTWFSPSPLPFLLSTKREDGQGTRSQRAQGDGVLFSRMGSSCNPLSKSSVGIQVGLTIRA